MQPGRHTVSVMIPTYNRVDFLEACVDSLLAQTLPPAQILVVDDGSTDATPELLGRLAPRVESMRVAQQGKSGAINAGLPRIAGEYLWVFDDDDTAVPDAIERLVDAVRADPACLFSYGTFWRTPRNADGSRGEPVESRMPDVHSRGFLIPLLESNFLGGGTFLAATSCYREVGGFDPTLLRSQDYDMAIRLARRFQGRRVQGGPLFHRGFHPGMRGPSVDRFGPEEQRKKWLEYDQLIFRRLYQELPMEAYLPPGATLCTHRRGALLQRAAIMANKDLFEEVLADLTEVARGNDQTPLTDPELLVSRSLGKRSYYGRGLHSDSSLLSALSELREASPVLAEVFDHLKVPGRRDTMTPTTSHDGVRNDLKQRGFAGPVPILSENQRRVFLEALDGKAEPAPLDWLKGHAVTSRLFYEIAVHPPILNVVSAILGKSVILWGASVIRRPPGSSHPWHTDIESRQPEGGTLSVWIGLQHTTPQSALRVVPHSHAFGVSVQEMAHREGKRRTELTDEDVERWARAHHPESGPQNLELHDGDALFFDGRLWHGSQNIDSPHTRVALLLQYAVPSTPIRMPDPKNLEWPFQVLAAPLPPCLLLRGDSDGVTNRIVPAPGPVTERTRPRLDSRICVPPLPIEPNPQSGWTPKGLFRGQTADLPDFACHVSVLACGKIPHPPHTHAEEELLLVLTGEAEVILPGLAGTTEGERRRLRRGDFVYYPAHFEHTLQAVSPEGTHYLMIKWLGPATDENAPLQYGQYSALGSTGESGKSERPYSAVQLFQGPTAWLRRLHCHVSTLAPGGGYAAHADAYDVAMIVLEGEVETLTGRVGPNGVIYYAAGEPHGINNPGASPARYVVFEFHGGQTAFSQRRANAPATLEPHVSPGPPALHGALRELVRLALPPAARVLVISKGDTDLLACIGPNAAHFPQAADGTYLGYHPGDSQEALKHLESLRGGGAQYLVIPEPSLWWLEFYAEFRRHLDVHCPMVAYVEGVGAIFALRKPVFRPRVPLS